METIEESDVVKYLLDGREVIVCAETNSGNIVRNVYYDKHSDEEYLGDPYLSTSKMFDNPPEEKYYEEIEKLIKTQEDLQYQIINLKQEKTNIEKEISDIKKEESRFFGNVQRIDQLKLLEDFINGKITHYLIFHYSFGWNIITIKETELKENYHHAKYLKLLTLYGESNGDLNWKLSEYSCSSSSGNLVIPCTSYEMALDELKKIIYSRIEESNFYDENIIKLSEKYDIEIPKEYVDGLKEQKRKQLEEKIELRKKDIEKIEKEITNLN